MQSVPTKILFFSKLTSGNLEHKIKHIFHLQKENNPSHDSPSSELTVYDRKGLSGLESLADNMASHLWLKWWLFCRVELAHFELLWFPGSLPTRGEREYSFHRNWQHFTDHSPLSLKSGTWRYKQMLVKSCPVLSGRGEDWVGASIRNELLQLCSSG